MSSIPLPGGAWLSGTQMQQAVGSLFLGNETALNLSANQAGYHGTLPQSFMIAGHSAGGGLATLAAGDYVADLGANTASNHLLGVVMFDGVASNSSAFAAAIANLKTLNIPDYVVAAPPQAWNLQGATTNELVSLYPGQFVGVELVNGSHVDSMLGNKPVIDFFSQLVTKFSPGGDTAAVYTLSTGWINDIYARGGPDRPDVRHLRAHRRLPAPRRPADHPGPGHRDRTAGVTDRRGTTGRQFRRDLRHSTSCAD